MLRGNNSNLPSQLLFAAVLVLVLAFEQAAAQTTSFTYQGRLNDGGTAANGTYDMQFKLYDTQTVGTGSLQGSPNTVTNSMVQVTNGIFTVQLDFGGTGFPGADRFLEIGVRPNGSVNPYTVLSPRQPITSTPYAVRSSNSALADTATNATQLGGVAASQYVQTNDSRLSDSRAPTAGSSNYIQNTTSQQSSSNFNISGNGTAGGTLSGNAVNTTTQYNIGGSRVLSAAGTNNTFAGLGAGGVNTGTFNSFFGNGAGASNTSGINNSFFGESAGLTTTTGKGNSFFGRVAGGSNTTGENNSFFGAFAGLNNTTGSNNSFVGHNAGGNNTTGGSNVVIGSAAGTNLTAGSNNIYIANPGVANESNAIRIGAGGVQTAVFFPGIFGNVITGSAVLINASGQLGVAASSRRYKKDIRDMGNASSKLMQLRPVTFLYRPEYVRGDQTLQYGLIAEEVAKVYPELVEYTADGQPQSVRYHLLNTMLLNEMQKQRRLIQAQAQQISDLSARLARIETLVPRSRAHRNRLGRRRRLAGFSAQCESNSGGDDRSRTSVNRNLIFFQRDQPR